jgi:hypothetical protein
VIYFASTGCTYDQPVKIGFSEDPDRRMVELTKQHREPVYLLVDVEGGFDLEREYHSRFAAGRLAGEWFDPETPGLQEEIQRLQDAYVEKGIQESFPTETGGNGSTEPNSGGGGNRTRVRGRTDRASTSLGCD